MRGYVRGSSTVCPFTFEYPYSVFLSYPEFALCLLCRSSSDWLDRCFE